VLQAIYTTHLAECLGNLKKKDFSGQYFFLLLQLTVLQQLLDIVTASLKRLLLSSVLLQARWSLGVPPS